MQQMGGKYWDQWSRAVGAAIDPGVGVYVDGIFMPRSDTQLVDVVDMQSIQVLRGPQGTLFGKNTAGGALLLTWALVALSVIDFDTQYLPDAITLPFLWLGLAFNVAGVYTTTQASVIGAIVGYLALWSVYHLFRLITGKEGMGYGDFKLLALFGAWLGWSAVPVIVLLSSFVGAIVGIALIALRGHDKNIPIPFGPYLAVAGWIALMWGDQLVDAYLGVSGLNQ